MEFGDLAHSLSAHLDTSGKRPKFSDGTCPVAKCHGTVTGKDFGDGDPVLRCSAGCDEKAILAALEHQHSESARGVLANTRKAGEPSSPAASLKQRPKPEPPRQITASDDVLRRTPPQNLEAEMSLLGAVFLDPEALNQARAIIQADDLYREAHREIYKTMLELSSRGVGIDALTLSQALKSHNLLEQVGGSGYLAELADSTPTTAHQKHYAEIVRDMAIKRRVATLTTDLASMAYNGVSADALVGEFQRIAGSLDTVKKNAVQDIFGASIQPLTGKDLVRRAKANPGNRMVCDGFLYRKQVSMWAGKVEAGKTSLLRELSMCIIRGEPFLERHCVVGRVTYLMLDADGEDLTFDEFQKMGWNPEEEDNLEFIFDPIFAQKPRALDQFHEYLMERQPSLVVIDPLGRFIKADDFNAYGMTYVMAVISELAKKTDCHFAVPQHIPRGRNDDADAATAAFGSIAIGGSVNARFVCTHKPGNIYTLKSSRGKGAGFIPLEEEAILRRDEQSGRITIAGAYSWKDQAKALMDQVFKLIESSEEALTAGDIAGRLGIMRSAASSAAQMLYSEKRPEYRRIDREGKGKAGSAFKFKKLAQSELSQSNEYARND